MYTHRNCLLLLDTVGSAVEIQQNRFEAHQQVPEQKCLELPGRYPQQRCCHHRPTSFCPLLTSSSTHLFKLYWQTKPLAPTSLPLPLSVVLLLAQIYKESSLYLPRKFSQLRAEILGDVPFPYVFVYVSTYFFC